MSKKKYNGFDRASEWLGQRATTLHPLANSIASIPAGTQGRVTYVSPRGLQFKADKCACCGLSLTITHVAYHDLQPTPSPEPSTNA